MKRLISTKFFLMVKEASQTGIDGCNDVLKKEYDEFAMLLFTESKAIKDKEDFLHILHYTCVEFSHLTPVTKKKCVCLY